MTDTLLGEGGIASLGSAGDGPSFYAPRYRVLIDGKELHERGSDFLSVQFKDSIKDLSGFELTLNNWDDGGEGGRPRFKYSEPNGVIELGKRVELLMGYADRPGMEQMMIGEIIAMDPTFPATGGPTIVVRGVDRFHRLRNKPKDDSFKNKTDAQIARAIADRNDLKVGQIDDTSPQHPVVPQDSQDDLKFLLERAKRINFELFIRGDKLYFRKPRETDEPTLTLVWGSSLASFTPSLTLAKQVSEVTVRGWHPVEGRLIEKTVTRAQLRSITANGKDAGQILEDALGGQSEGKKEVITREGVLSDEDAEKLAISVLMRTSYSFVTGTGQTVGLPKLRAGTTVQLSKLGTRFDGKYYVTETTHRIDNGGYSTSFNARKVYA